MIETLLIVFAGRRHSRRRPAPPLKPVDEAVYRRFEAAGFAWVVPSDRSFQVGEEFVEFPGGWRLRGTFVVPEPSMLALGHPSNAAPS